ncbi:MAG TPA: hypothetical protein VLF93_02555 [Candidatus Saccharimonadales bacterium]|nr:hypothetical protein [Candidatus Saccharimonadales bacterium]
MPDSKQKSNEQLLISDRYVWIGLLVIWVLYSYLTFQTPSGQAITKYQISLYQITLLKFSIIVPVSFIWAAILYCSLKLYRYSQTIITSVDGQGFRSIAHGVFFFLIASILSSFISLGAQFYPNYPELVKNVSILNNYVMVAFSFVSFYFIWLGSKKLVTMINAEKKAKKLGVAMWFTVILLSLPYIYLVLHTPLRSMSTNPNLQSTYNLPDVLIFSTIVLPYILSWLLGLLALTNMSVFGKETKGIFYKNALKKFYKGFWIIIILAISLQYLTQFSLFFSNATLSIILFIIYLILLVDIAGFIFMAIGANRLSKIETS